MYDPTCHPISTELASQWNLVGRPVLVCAGTFVQRSHNPGRRWLRLSLLSTGWNVTAYKTRAEAIEGEFAWPGKGLPFEFGGANVWGHQAKS